MKLLAIFFSFLIVTTTLIANDKEDILRGAVLQRINQFITYKDNKKEFIICVYDNEKIANIFKKLYKNHKYKNLPIQVKNIRKISNIEQCDILYVKSKNKKIIKNIKANSVFYTLLVTEDIDILEEGFMLALYLKNNKIKFALNHQAIHDTKLKVNYRLLKVASKVINPLKK